VRAARAFVPDPVSPRLARLTVGDRTELFTETVGAPPPVYGERWADAAGHAFRTFEPGRSKLSAAIVRGWTGPLPVAGETWLYLGAASGTTASHLADLLGPSGRLYAVERSPRPFGRLLALAERWPNLYPILADARAPREFAYLVPPVDGVYADVAQPDQVAIVRANAQLFIDQAGGSVLMALKTASMGRDRDAEGHRAVAERDLADGLALAPAVKLDPFHRGHYLLGGRVRSALFGERAPVALRPSRGPRPSPRRP
jgi:fibrillarin-like pre-rRNA processing protein